MIYQGYYKEEELPIKREDTITIPKGVKVKTTHPTRKEYVTKRAQKIKVDHILNGRSINEMMFGKEFRYYVAQGYPVKEKDNSWPGQPPLMEKHVLVKNPTIRWAGTGGYWCEVDINDLLSEEK